MSPYLFQSRAKPAACGAPVVATSLGLVLTICAACATAATTWTVTTIQDDAAPGVACQSATECYTLRDALHSAMPGDIIVFNLTGYTLPATIKLTNAEPLLPPPGITIQGPGFDQLSISAQGASRVFDLPDQPSSVLGDTINHLTITAGRVVGANGVVGASGGTAGASGANGTSGGDAVGGCIYVGTHTTLELDFDNITGCVAVAGQGGPGGNGAQGAAGTDSSQTGATGGSGGSGGIGGNGGNGGGALGAAIAVQGTGHLILNSSTLSENIADGGAGGAAGQGGAGGTGGTGGPSACVQVSNGPCLYIGPGGTGGTGGNGGNGGNGGAMGFSGGGAIAAWGRLTAINSTIADNTVINGLSLVGPSPSGGNGGVRGEAGAGGAGGPGQTQGPTGSSGTAGAGGIGGSGGVVEGGAIFHYNTDANNGSVLEHSTIAFNQATAGQPGLGANGSGAGADGFNSGGGVQNQTGGVITFWNSIIASNQRTDDSGTKYLANCGLNGAATQENDNLSDDASCGADTQGDPKFAPPKGGKDAYAWGGNGLPVLMPMPGSPAIGGAKMHYPVGGPPTGGCSAADDERGVARPQATGILGATCDLGAVESDVIFVNGFETP